MSEPNSAMSDARLNRLRDRGFEGFVSVANLRTNHTVIPDASGVYFLLRPDSSRPVFLKKGTGGWFKGKNPNVFIGKLTREWVEGALVIYIGCTGNLKKRIKDQLLPFGQGIPVGHWGGRLVWQLEGAEQLLVCWKVTRGDDQEKIKQECLNQFKLKYSGKRPFANLKG